MTSFEDISDEFVGKTVTRMELVEVRGGDEVWLEFNGQVLVVGFQKRGGMYLKHGQLVQEVLH